MENRVIVRTDIIVNYIFHILAVSNNEFDTEYSVIFKDTVLEQDKEILRGLRNYLSYFNGGEGKLFDVVVRLPAYLGLDSSEDFKKYWYILKSCLESSDFTDFEVYYNDRYLQFDFWQGFSTEIYLNSIKDHIEIMKDIFEIYSRNFEIFKTDVWDMEKKRLSQRAKEIEIAVSGIGIIEKWELFGNVRFEPKNMEFYIVSSVQNGITAIPLGFERKVISGDFLTEDYANILTYETGVNLFNPFLKKMINDQKYPVRIIYKCYEAVLQYFTKIITEDSSEDFFKIEKGLKRIISDKVSQGFEDAHELFDKVIDSYLKSEN